jgi:hypothetical protein
VERVSEKNAKEYELKLRLRSMRKENFRKTTEELVVDQTYLTTY